MKQCDFLIRIERIFENKDFQDIQLKCLETELSIELDHIAERFVKNKSVGISYFNLTLVNAFAFKKRYQAYIEKSEDEDTKSIVDSGFNEFVKEEILIKRNCWDLFIVDFIGGILEIALTEYEEYFDDDKNLILLDKYVKKSRKDYRAYVITKEEKDSIRFWMKAFFPKENDILPLDDYARYMNLLSGKQKSKIDLQIEPWRVFAVLMVWAENDKLNLTKYTDEKKANKLHVKVSHFMADNFKFKGDDKDNSYFNESGYRPLKRFSDPSCDTIHLRFIKRLNEISGKIGFN